ncbi:universal stress protein [Methanocorpusculum vombati]|uniref:Universal stress protein n=1 Tax=Methanocorpusculum vombati TaxID=3002864 RepID=A0ABT4IP24_9EURY|nr:universal stress protein [Methanocorpusculum vombati]MCZ9319608.1 universal stress protein [Methanocorpusculum sp.]MCZ0862875.1 universal stress protein [Methanocorpusculum vombati]MDE2520852.1 universal stress protein [Methanocorpusculum sp.]MDE2533705.1 universal stress protein [Methanocorpusculum sp.]MDE2546071.1 universal stress protein [Methanocorpusculum sp.]
MFTRILVALDGSEISRIAYSRALELAREDNAELHVITVVNSPHIWKDDSPANQTRTETDAKMLLDELENTAKEAGVSFTPHLVSGHPGDRIVSTADEIDADLILVGSLGKSHLDRLLLGSVSAYVTQYSMRNILVIRG